MKDGNLNKSMVDPVSTAVEHVSGRTHCGANHGFLMDFLLPDWLQGEEITNISGRFVLFRDQVMFRLETADETDDSSDDETPHCAGAVFEGDEFCMDECLVSDQMDPRLLPLFKYFDDTQKPLRLIGKSSKGHYQVLGLDIESVKKDENELSRLLNGEMTNIHLKKVINRLLLSITCSDDYEWEKPVIFSNANELKFLLATCGRMYRQDIKAWAEHNLNVFENTKTSNEEKKHILRALTYILNIDWNLSPISVPEIVQTQKLLDEEFYGLESVKQRVLEVVAQIKRTGFFPASGILLSGPPGVGKSTIANAIARILNRPKVTLDMSTIEDGEAITGSSRIYNNAKPGLIVEKLYSQLSTNVVMVINELDKAATRSDSRSPADALLTLLDGLGFIDSFIETAIPTDGIFFVATCNDPGKISKPLLDRFLRIDIPAYSREDKQIILTKYVLPRLMNRLRLSSDDFLLSPDSVQLLCSKYAVEPGVRDLSQFAEKLLSHYLLECEKTCHKKVVYKSGDIAKILGPVKVYERTFKDQPGLVRSVYCNEGRAHLYIVQTTVRPGKGEFRTIGIYTQSEIDFCQTAYECVRNGCRNGLQNLDVTVFISEQTSNAEHNVLGTAVYASIISALSGVSLPSHTAFIGGCDLFGNTFIDDSTIEPYIKVMEEAGIRTLYAPLGTGKRIFSSPCSLRMKIIEALEIKMLVTMALSDGLAEKRDKSKR